MAYELNTSSTGYRSGVVGGPPPANSPTTFSVSAADSSDFVASDVGRIIRILDGPAAGQIRWITSFVNANQVMIDSPWNVEPFRAFNAGNGSPITANNPTYTQVLGTPTTGSSYQLAFTMDELFVLAAGDIVRTGDTVRRGREATPSNVIPGKTYTLQPNVYDSTGAITTDRRITITGVTLQCEDLTFVANWRSGFISPPAAGAAMIFGRLNAGDVSDDNGLPYAHHGVNIVDTSREAWGENQFEPQLHVYGSKWESAVDDDTFNFFRINGDDDAIVRFFDNNITGNFGGRFQGERSVFLNNTISTSRTNAGFFNPVAGTFFGINQGNRFFDCDQAIYHWFDEGGTAETNIEGFVDIQNHVARLLAGGPGNNQLTFRNFPIRDYITAQGGTNSNGTIPEVIPLVFNNFFNPEPIGRTHDRWRIIQDIDISIVDENGAAITEPASLYYEDQTGAGVTTNEQTSTGSFDRLSLLYDSRTCGRDNNTQFIIQPDDDDRLFPYNAVVAVNGRVPQFFELDLEAVGGIPEVLRLTMITDNNVTDTNSIDTIAGLITEGNGLASAVGYSNAQAHYKFINPEIPSVSSELFTRSGNDIIFDDSPEFDVVVDFSATTPLSYNETSSVLTMGVPVGVEAGVSGTSANLIPQLGRTLRFVGTAQDGAVIRGGFGALGNPTTVEFGFSTRQADGILIQTDQPLFGTIALPAGNFIIDRVNGATLDDLTITRASGTGTVNIIVRNASGSPTFNSAQVQVITSLDITINGPAAGTGRIDLFEDGTFTRFAGEVGPMASFDTTDSNRISGGRDIIVCWSGPSHADVRFPLTLDPGSNVLGISPAVSQAPPFTASEYSNVQDALNNYDTDIAGRLDVNLALRNTGLGNPLDSSVGFNAWFHNRVKGGTSYNQMLASNPTAVNAAQSNGPRTFIDLNGDFIKLSPRVNASINTGFIENTGTEGIAVDRVITGATFIQNGATVTQDITFTVNIAESPSDFDLVAVTNAVDELLDNTQKGVAYTVDLLGDNPLITAPGSKLEYDRDTDYTTVYLETRTPPTP